MTREERDAFLADLEAARRDANRAARVHHAAEQAYEALWMDPRRRLAEEWAAREVAAREAGTEAPTLELVRQQ